jgi:hypothetical protein
MGRAGTGRWVRWRAAGGHGIDRPSVQTDPLDASSWLAARTCNAAWVTCRRRRGRAAALPNDPLILATGRGASAQGEYHKLATCKLQQLQPLSAPVHHRSPWSRAPAQLGRRTLGAGQRRAAGAAAPEVVRAAMALAVRTPEPVCDVQRRLRHRHGLLEALRVAAQAVCPAAAGWRWLSAIRSHRGQPAPQPACAGRQPGQAPAPSGWKNTPGRLFLVHWPSRRSWRASGGAAPKQALQMVPDDAQVPLANALLSQGKGPRR